ncbi:MAG: hypothetical protein ACI8Z9_000431 [Paraglaciecola sp.]|jgi:hypothetical protein
MKSVLGWVAGIAASVIAGVFLWYFTKSPSDLPPLTFTQLLPGSYRLSTWQEAAGPITMGVKAKSGTMRISQGGNADWELQIWDSAKNPDTPTGATKSRIKCAGTVSLQTKSLNWTPSGSRNVAIDWERGITSVRDMVWPAFCGGTSAVTATPFSLHVVEQDGGRKLLEMSNSKGAFRWISD